MKALSVTSSPQTRETILVVDDEPALCRIAEMLLTRCGYRVITASDPEQAKLQMLQNPNIDLLLTDVELQGLLGDKLAGWFQSMNPRGAIVFMSGSPAHRVRFNGHPFIEKPFVHLDALVSIIRETLAQQRTDCLVAAVAA